MEFINGDMTVNGMVGGGQTFTAEGGGNLNIGDPGQFFGHVNLSAYDSSAYLLGGVVDLVGLAGTSYDYSNDVLTLWNGNHVAARLNLTGSGIGVYQSSGHSSGPYQPAGMLVSNNPNWGNGHTALPQHTFGV